jgi:hypothetical protein
MPWTASQLAALEDAIARGVKTVTHNGKSVTYASTAEMLEFRDRMKRELESATTPRPKAGFGSFHRGGR